VLLIDLNTHHLLGYTPNQPVEVYVAGGDQVAGLNLNITTDAGTLTRIDALSGIFAGGIETFPGGQSIYRDGHLGVDYVSTQAGSVVATDFLATANGPTNFVTWPGIQVIVPVQNDATMIVDAPEPSTLAMLGLVGLLIFRRRVL
jgi:hypothetical protein